MIRKCVQFCADRQTVDSNVTGCMVIAYWIINCTDTNSQNVLFNYFFPRIITPTCLSNMLQVHYLSFLAFSNLCVVHPYACLYFILISAGIFNCRYVEYCDINVHQKTCLVVRRTVKYNLTFSCFM